MFLGDINNKNLVFYMDSSTDTETKITIFLRDRFLTESGKFKFSPIEQIENTSKCQIWSVNNNLMVCNIYIGIKKLFFTIEFNEIKPEEDKLRSNPLQSKKESLKEIVQNLQLARITNLKQIETSVKNLQMDKNFSMVKKMSSGKEQICQIREENMSLILFLKTIWNISCYDYPIKMTKASGTRTKDFTPVSELINRTDLSDFYSENEVYINASTEYGPFYYYVAPRLVTQKGFKSQSWKSMALFFYVIGIVVTFFLIVGYFVYFCCIRCINYCANNDNNNYV